MAEYFADPFFGALFGVGCGVLALTAASVVLALLRRGMLRRTGSNENQEESIGGYRAYLSPNHGMFHFTVSNAEHFPKFEVETSHERGVHFSSGTPEFDRFFSKRHADPAVVARLWANGDRMKRAAHILKRRAWAMSYISVDGYSATWNFKWRLPDKEIERVKREMAAYLDELYSAVLFPPLRLLPHQTHSAAYRQTQAPLPQGSYFVENADGPAGGPFSPAELLEQLHEGRITPMTRVSPDGSSKWRQLGFLKDLRGLFGPEPEQAPAHAWRTQRDPIQIARYSLTRYAASRIALTLSALAWGFFGIGAGHAKVTAERATESTSWPHTSGKIVESKVVKSTSTSSSRHGGSSSKTTYSPKIEYAYEVRGKQYKSQRLWFGESVSGSQASARLVALYPVGLQVQVFYRASDPSLSVLRAGEQEDMALWMILTAFFFFVLSLLVPAQLLWQLRLGARARADATPQRSSAGVLGMG